MERRTAPGDPRRPIKLDISAPITSPPAPSSKLMDKNSERQAAYNQSLTVPRRPPNASRVKRWSLSSWRTQSARMPTPEPILPQPTVIEESVASSPTATERRFVGLRDHKRSESEPTPKTPPLRSSSFNVVSKRLPIPMERGVMSLRIQRKASSEALVASQRHGIVEDPLQPVPRSSRVRGISLSDQRWSPPHSLKSLGTIQEFQSPLSPVHPRHHQARNSFGVPRQYAPVPQMPKKAASTGMLRPQIPISAHLTVPDRPGVPTTTDQVDQRHIHPALRSPSPPTTSPTLSLFPAIPPHPEIVPRPVPRVRIIPPSTVIDPDEINTAETERAILASRPPLLREQLALLRNMNATRATVCIGPLDLHPLLSNRAQD